MRTLRSKILLKINTNIQKCPNSYSLIHFANRLLDIHKSQNLFIFDVNKIHERI